MTIIIDWLTNIIIFILLLTIFELLLPQSSLQKYTKMVMSLLLMSLIVTPIFSLTKLNFDDILSSIFHEDDTVQIERMQSELNKYEKEINQLNDTYILEELVVQLQKDHNEELIEKFNVKISQVQFVHDKKGGDDQEEKLNKAIVFLKEVPQSREETHADNDKLIKVNKISFGGNSQEEKEESFIKNKSKLDKYFKMEIPLFGEIDFEVREEP